MNDKDSNTANTFTYSVSSGYGSNASHPDLIAYSTGLIDYLTDAIRKHNEMVNHVVELRAELDKAYKALGLPVSEPEPSFMSEIKNNIEKEITSTVKAVEAKIEAKVEKKSDKSIWKKLWKWF